MAENIAQVSDATFDSEVLKSSVPVLIDFWAPWCGPCRAIAPIVDELAGEYAGKLKVVKMNVDDNPRTPAQYGVRGIPNLILLGTYLATQTERLKFGCAFNVVPMWHPIRLAEDFAMADILTGGRVIFGVGRGYHTREVETFGAPMLDNDANKEFFEEQMEIILKCFNEESFSYQGKHYTIPAPVPYRGYDLKEITVVPRPIHRPAASACGRDGLGKGL